MAKSSIGVRGLPLSAISDNQEKEELLRAWQLAKIL
jgi:hypothetical protein